MVQFGHDEDRGMPIPITAQYNLNVRTDAAISLSYLFEINEFVSVKRVH